MPRRILDIYHGERGIDLGEWKRRHDLWGVIVKCGGSDDRRWNRYEETTWVEQVTQAHALGLHVGAYYYSDALDATEALEDAKHCVDDCMRGMSIDLPIYLDIEERSQLSLPMYRLTDVVTTFCEYVRNAGYEVGIYSGYEGFHNMFEDRVSSYSLWVAAWRTSWPIWASDYDLWQEGSMDIHGNVYRRNEDVDGAGHVDLDWASDAFVARIEQGGGKVARRKIDVANVAALIHMDMVTDPRNGYSQSPRWGGDHPDGVKHLTIDGHDYVYALGSYDCSSSSKTAWEQALRYTKYEGCLGHLGQSGATCTSDFNEAFTSTGLFRCSLSPAKRGDLYNSSGHHVAMCQDGGGDGVYGYDCLSEFNRNEHHAATGGQVGDQDGGEAVMRGYYNYPWETVIHYVGGFLEDVTDNGSDDMEASGTMAILYDGSDDKVYYWTGDPESVPYHVSGAEKEALERMYRLKLRKLDVQTANAIMGMCKKRKQWREEGIASAINKNGGDE